MASVDSRLIELGIDLPPASVPVGNYLGYTIAGNLVFISGQLPIKDGSIAVKGKVGGEVSLEQGYEAARICGLNILSQLKAALGGSLDGVKRVVRLGGFVCVT